MGSKFELRENLGGTEKGTVIIRRPTRILFKGSTRFADVVIAEDVFGFKEVYLDRILQSSTRDEFIYHEALVHPLMWRKKVEKALIIGGGEGATAREVLKYHVEEVTMVDIDEEFVETVRKYIPEMSSGAFEDPRLNLVFMDAWDFVKSARDRWDVAFVDVTEPEGPARRLYTLEFYKMLGKIVDSVSVFAGDLDGLFEDGYQARYVSTIGKVFPYVMVGTIYVPTFLASELFVLASKEPLGEPRKADVPTRMYDLEADRHIFSLPKHVRGELQKEYPPFTLSDPPQY